MTYNMGLGPEFEDPRIRIESSYGTPEKIGWAYHAIDMKEDSIILEGEVENETGMCKLLLRPNEGGRIDLPEEIREPYVADHQIKLKLMGAARRLLEGESIE